MGTGDRFLEILDRFRRAVTLAGHDAADREHDDLAPPAARQPDLDVSRGPAPGRKRVFRIKAGDAGNLGDDLGRFLPGRRLLRERARPTTL